MKRPEISALYMETSAPPNSSKKRKPTSDVWNHFIKETDQNGIVWAKCKHCGKSFSGLSKDGTTHLKNHLNSSKCKRSQKETGGLENPTVTNGNFVFDEERSGLDLVRMIIKDGYPMNMVENECFKILMKNLQPAFKLPTQDTLKDKILCLYREEKEKLRKQFDKVLSFCLILNFWTDCGKKSKYCSFTLQFIEDGPKLMKKNIAIKNVEYNYTGKTLFEIVKGVLLEWNIGKKLATITVESSCANDEMVGILKGWLGDQGNCHPLRKKIFHFPCITHAMNLLVGDVLDQMDIILLQIRRAIKCMSETKMGKQKFEEVVKKLELGGKDITSEGVPVRWDSTFFMLQIALELRRQGKAFVEGVLDVNLSEEEEWDRAKAGHKCLSVFYDAICSFFGSKCLSTNVYFRKILDISNRLTQLAENGIASAILEKLHCHGDEIRYVSTIVAVFDPRTKLDFVEYSFGQSCCKIPDTWKTPTLDLGDMFNLYAEYLTSQRSSSSFINNDNSSSSDGDDPCNILEDWKKWKSQRTELEKYLQEPLQPHEDEEFDILGWWHTKSQDSPTLSAMARDILAIPMSTSTSNSAFCIETATLDPMFNDLDPDIIEALFCGKDWLDNPIRIAPNKDNDHSIANPEPMPENPDSTSGPEPLQTGDTLHVWSGTSEPQEKHDLSNADAEPMLADCSATSCPEPIPLPNKKHAPSTTNKKLMLPNLSSTPQPFPTGVIKKSSDHGSSGNDAEAVKSCIRTMEFQYHDTVAKEMERLEYEAQLAAKEAQNRQDREQYAQEKFELEQRIKHLEVEWQKLVHEANRDRHRNVLVPPNYGYPAPSSAPSSSSQLGVSNPRGSWHEGEGSYHHLDTTSDISHCPGLWYNSQNQGTSSLVTMDLVRASEFPKSPLTPPPTSTPPTTPPGPPEMDQDLIQQLFSSP